MERILTHIGTLYFNILIDMINMEMVISEYRTIPFSKLFTCLKMKNINRLEEFSFIFVDFIAGIGQHFRIQLLKKLSEDKFWKGTKYQTRIMGDGSSHCNIELSITKAN